MSSKEKNIPEEEVDLGNLFVIIGKGFRNLFNAIGSFFEGLFRVLIQLLLFIKKHAIKIVISLIFGAILGLILDFTSSKIYHSTMIVEPNFNSTQQLYSNIQFYHELVRQKETAQLAELFQISEEEAKDLKGFYVEPIKNENEKYEYFNNFIEEIDTATIRRINMKDFSESFTDFDYRYHKIKVKSKNSNVFEKLSFPIVSSIESNVYFKNQKKINDQNLSQNESVLKQSLKEVDTLRKIYNEVLLLEAKKSESGTTITMAEGAKKTGELELFSESLNLNRALIENNKKKAETMEIINVVSDFSKSGSRERGIFNKFSVLLGLGFALLMLLSIFLKELNKYLVNYKQ